ncbi:MAG: hypothetical protein J6W96_00530 [Alphaproteobacteria bacterium]|nr:hypothetical protein [Alphaproteobacteria bacterium]
MRKTLYIFTFLILQLFPLCALGSNFIEGFEDIPLMNGLKQIESQNFSFSNEEAGYTEAILVANKKESFEKIKYFYIDVLPKLGWKLRNSTESSLVFLRDNDVLEISKQQSRPLKIAVNIKSKN